MKFIVFPKIGDTNGKKIYLSSASSLNQIAQVRGILIMCLSLITFTYHECLVISISILLKI